MREILFRAKQHYTKEWLYGAVVKDGDECLIMVGEPDGLYKQKMTVVEESTVGQFTGFTDKNGNKIFENDVLWADGSYELTVCWDDENAMFYAEYEGTKSGHEDDDNDDYVEACDFINYEVIGNKFDNPELLTKE